MRNYVDFIVGENEYDEHIVAKSIDALGIDTETTCLSDIGKACNEDFVADIYRYVDTSDLVYVIRNTDERLSLALISVYAKNCGKKVIEMSFK